MELKYLTKKEAKDDKDYFIERADNIRLEAKDDFSICFSLVGSSKRNMILIREDIENDPYDYDYQLLLAKNKKDKSQKEIKDYFLDLFKDEFTKEDNWKVEDSTSAITIKKIEDCKLKYSYDVVIIKTNAKTLKSNILKHYKKDENNSEDKYCWEEIPDYKTHRENLKQISGTEDWSDLREIYKGKQEDNKDKPKIEKIKSYLLFIQSVNEFAQKNDN